MKVLITNHHLVEFSGTEIFTLELACGLKNAGHEVVVYSKFIDKFAAVFKKEAIRFVSNLELIKNEKFDIGHIHHNISAIEIRNSFPDLPLFYLSHGAAHFLENPPQLEVNIALYGAVSEGIARELKKGGIPAQKIVVFRNIVNENMFYPQKKLHSRAKTALILSAKIDEQKEKVIRHACKKLKIELHAVGGRFGHVPYHQIAQHIQKADIVFTIGRGVIETMMCGKIPFVFDTFGGDGFVTTDNFALLMRRNFSGLTHRKSYTTTSLTRELKKYSKNEGPLLQRRAFSEFSTASQISRMEKLYKRVIKLHRTKKIPHELLEPYVQTIKASIYYQSRMGKTQLKRDYRQYKEQLEKITSSKFFKLYPLYEGLKNLVKKYS